MTRTWILTLGMLVVLLGGWEIFWRARGWTPSVEGNEEAWILARDRVHATSTVLTGSSRIMAAFQPEVWVRAMGGDWPIQLGLHGGSPLPILEDLAADPDFHGTVIAELLPYFTFRAGLRGETSARDFLRSHRRMRGSPAIRWEAYLRTRIAGRLVFRRYRLLPPTVTESYHNRKLLLPPLYSLRPDRFQPIRVRPDPTGMDMARVMDSTHFRFLRTSVTPLTGAGADSVLARIARSVLQIQSRGGEVYLVYLRSCGGRRSIEYDMFPKAAYVDRLSELPGVRLLDSDLDPELASVPCRDGSHVAEEDTPLVTKRIARFVSEVRLSTKP